MLKILILIKPFHRQYPKHQPKMDMITAIERYADVRYWHTDGHIHNIINELSFKPDFIFHYDMSKYLSPNIEGLKQTKIPKGCFVYDVHWKQTAKKMFFLKNNFDLIFSVSKNPFLAVFPELASKFRWLPWAINPAIFKDWKQKKDILYLLTGLVYSTDPDWRSYAQQARKGRYLFRETVLSKMKNEPGFVFHPHPGHLTSDKNALVNKNYAKQINRAHIFFTCGARVPKAGKYPVQKFFEAPACKTLLLAEPNEDIRDLGFIDGVNYVACDTNDFYNKARYYIDNERERKKITEAGYQLIRHNHTNNIRAKQFVRIVQTFLDMQ
ncbi:glycosyltransferase [Shouchella lonarensis]|uniref:Glycosyl transferases group 1 n=1 Tax=Shouchella lonarensis TaxID=1464122 RepID=A0A1G6L6C2_9BACI|nr:glycosyltransferase [Shouchella lonarensis]SDC38862.1 Glycosyl transferases group 1 [Shouchella lonarensis]